MAFRQYSHKLLNAVTIGPGSYVTPALDLRGEFQRIVRVNSVLIQATSASGTPFYDLYYAGGAQSSEFQSNLPDVFESNTWNASLLNNIQDELLHVVPMPSVYAPFVRFIVITDLTAPADCVFNLWALGQERFDV